MRLPFCLLALLLIPTLAAAQEFTVVRRDLPSDLTGLNTATKRWIDEEIRAQLLPAFEEIKASWREMADRLLARLDGVTAPKKAPAGTAMPAVPAPSAKATQAFLTYSEAHAASLREKRPLCVWINYKCGSSQELVPGFLHTHLAGEGAERGVLVALPSEDGHLYSAGFVSAEECCAAALRDAVERSTRERAAAEQARHFRGWSASRDGACVG
jgi:hypothetical protein